MSIVTYAVVENRSQAEAIVTALKASGVPPHYISILFADAENSHAFVHEKDRKIQAAVGEGAGSGGIIGGTLGWIASLGLLAIPGAGPLIAAGPILSILSGMAIGAAVGGLGGRLVSLGIPSYKASEYETSIKGGNVLLSLQSDGKEEAYKATQLLQSLGARDISSVTKEEPVENNVNLSSTAQVTDRQETQVIDAPGINAKRFLTPEQFQEEKYSGLGKSINVTLPNNEKLSTAPLPVASLERVATPTVVSERNVINNSALASMPSTSTIPSIVENESSIEGYLLLDIRGKELGYIHQTWEAEGSSLTWFSVQPLSKLDHLCWVPALSPNVDVAYKRVQIALESPLFEQAPTWGMNMPLDDNVEKEVAHYWSKHQDIITQQQDFSHNAANTSHNEGDNIHLELKQEKAVITKKLVDDGGVRLRKVIRTEIINQPVEIQREEIILERVPPSNT